MGEHPHTRAVCGCHLSCGVRVFPLIPPGLPVEAGPDGCPAQGGLKIALRGGGGGGDGMGAWRRRGGVSRNGLPFVLCNDGCCHQRRRNTTFGPEKFLHEKIFPHICVVKMISATLGSF